MLRLSAVAASVLLMGTYAWPAETVAERELAVHEAARAKAAVAAERAARAEEAAALAVEIARLKEPAGGVRAGRDLSDRLRAFDRLVARLDELDRRLEQRASALARAVRAFEEAAAASSDPAAAGEARRRVEAAAAPRAFRPPLDVALDPADGAAEIEGKLLLLDAEKKRLDEERARLEAEDRLLAARMKQKQDQARELAVARRDVDRSLLAQQSEELRRAVARLTEEREALARAQAAREKEQAHVDARAGELAAALRRLSAPVGAR
jgi:hypothetical protein